jgi:hypothetical protein
MPRVSELLRRTQAQPQVHAHGYARQHCPAMASSRTGMKSMSRPVPSSVSNLVSSTMVSPRYRRRVADWAARRDQPPTVFLGTQQRSEDSLGVEPRYTQPVDRAVATG